MQVKAKDLFYLAFYSVFLAALYQFPLIKNPLLINPVVTFGVIIVGSFLSACFAGRNKLIIPVYSFNLTLGLIGGIIMGAGFYLAGLPQFANQLIMVQGVFYWVSMYLPIGLIYLTGVLIGGGVALHFLRQFYRNTQIQPMSDYTKAKLQRALPVILAALLTLLALIVIKEVISGQSIWNLIYILAALISGVVWEQNRICLNALLKEIFWTKSFDTAFRYLFVFIAAGGLIYFAGAGNPGKVPITFLNFTGSFLMGIGFVLAEGCFMGSLWKAGQGNLTSFAALGGIVVGGGLTPLLMEKVNLLFIDTKANLLLSAFKSTNSVHGANLFEPTNLLKFGFILLLTVWIGALFINPPGRVVLRGSKSYWLISEGAILLNLLVIIYFLGQWEGLQILGLVLYYGAVFLYIWARIVLGSNWGESILVRANHRIVRAGPYKLMKHPIYIAVFIGLIGCSLTLGSWAGLIASFTLTLPTLYFRARAETNLLIKAGIEKRPT